MLKYSFFSLENSDVGVNYIINKKVILLVPITQPYMNYGSNKLYFEPWSYIGFFTFPKLQKLWPDTKNIKTANQDYHIQNPLGLFEAKK